jgi:hypothetical protein
MSDLRATLASQATAIAELNQAFRALTERLMTVLERLPPTPTVRDEHAPAPATVEPQRAPPDSPRPRGRGRGGGRGAGASGRSGRTAHGAPRAAPLGPAPPAPPSPPSPPGIRAWVRSTTTASARKAPRTGSPSSDASTVYDYASSQSEFGAPLPRTPPPKAASSSARALSKVPSPARARRAAGDDS